MAGEGNLAVVAPAGIVISLCARLGDPPRCGRRRKLAVPRIARQPKGRDTRPELDGHRPSARTSRGLRSASYRERS